MGELNFFLGLQVKQSPKGTFICQQKYTRELLKRFDMEASKVIDTPIATATQLDMDETGPPVNQTMYRGIIGSLLYLTVSRPNIVFSVGLCARFQSNPKESHLKAAKRILRYLKGTQDMVLYYPSSDNFNLIKYVDTDYTGYLVDRKSTFGMDHFLGSCLITWGTRKQNLVALSTAKAESVATASCCAQFLWIKQQLENFGVKNLVLIPHVSSSVQSLIHVLKRTSGEQGQNPEVTEGSAIVTTDSVVAVVPIEEENVVTVFVVSADGILLEIISQKNEV
ncbi:uncharacterized mitochondrial protein AtMg00810-like [Nicotiana sylvestris]|uniref:uncharacterized mitochondrial protein AtMg00810-like n=1 Tax=Nicotiana sylvestris TaxID=4096 RepID=UPI00388CEADD